MASTWSSQGIPSIHIDFLIEFSKALVKSVTLVLFTALCTLIGIKTMSPDPIWPKPKPNRGDNKVHKYYIDSFVDDKYTDLLRLAAQ